MSYQPILDLLNTGIAQFNQSLNSASAIAPVAGTNTPNAMNIATIPWNQQFWPNKDSKGVYFLLGYQKANPATKTLYIGKASLQNIGERLYDHLNAYKNAPHYEMGDSILEYVITIPLTGAPHLATALEECLITHTKGKIPLLNTIGAK